MNYRLQNDYLTATIKDNGAELCSLLDSKQTEYIWTADSRYWGRHTPVLFPLVGKVLNNTYTHNGKSYTLGQHGFARDMNFSVSEQTDTHITFTLVANEETFKLYPFNFSFSITYTLIENNLHITYAVTNTDQETIGFKLGAHPGFRCPLFEGETMEDYYFEFEKEEDAHLMPLVDPGYFTGDTSTFKGQVIELSPEVFANDALVFTGLKSSKIALKSKKHNHYLEVSFPEFPFLGLWSPSTPSPFVCIEPWFGHADFTDEGDELMTKKDLVTLSPTHTFSCTHIMTIHA